MLHRPHLAGARAKGQSLRVAVAVGVDKGLRAAGPEGVVRRPGPGRLVHAQHLAAEGIQVLGDRRHRRVAGGDPQVVLGAEAQPAAAVPAPRAYGDAAHQGVHDAGGPRVPGVDGPRDHLYFRRRPIGVPVALAGVEAPVTGEIRVHHDSHQPDLEGIELVGEVPGALQLPNGPVGEADGQREVPFGKQHRAVGREGEVPGYEQVGDHGFHLDPGRRDRGGRARPRGRPGSVAVCVHRPDLHLVRLAVVETGEGGVRIQEARYVGPVPAVPGVAQVVAVDGRPAVRRDLPFHGQRRIARRHRRRGGKGIRLRPGLGREIQAQRKCEKDGGCGVPGRLRGRNGPCGVEW